MINTCVDSLIRDKDHVGGLKRLNLMRNKFGMKSKRAIYWIEKAKTSDGTIRDTGDIQLQGSACKACFMAIHELLDGDLSAT